MTEVVIAVFLVVGVADPRAVMLVVVLTLLLALLVVIVVVVPVKWQS